MVDLVELFTEIGVKHWTSGKNVSIGWVGIRCIFCNDHSNHLGVSLKKGNYSCWKCGSTGSLKGLLVEMGYTSRDAAELIRRHSTEAQIRYEADRVQRSMIDLSMFRVPLNEAQRAYLIGRDFNPDELVAEYGLMGGQYIAGPWKYRIIVPVIMRGEIVNYTGMAYGGQEPKYLHCPDDESVMTMKKTLYNYDSVQMNSVMGICEGVTDVWRMGRGFVATFGTKVTHDQIMLIQQKRPKEVIVMFDSDAQGEGEALAHQIAAFGNLRVFVAATPSGDPADLKKVEVLSIRKDWGFDGAEK